MEEKINFHGWDGLMPNEQNVQECDATDDAMKNKSRVKNFFIILVLPCGR
jgi:hypothetical protein